MSRPQGLGFGGFLVGLGTGWILFDWMNVTRNIFAWTLIIIGSGVVASGFISRWSQARHLGGIVRGLAGGLVLSLVVTSGMGFAGPVIGVGSLGSYRVSETRVLDGSMADGRVLVDVQVFNGGVEVSTWDREEYQLSVYVRAKGTSDADAQRNLEELELDFSESTVMGRRTLVLRHNVAPAKTSLYSVSVEVRLPASAVVDLDLTSSNGGFHITEVDGCDLNLKTSNGGVTFQAVTADTVNVDTSNGGVQGSLDALDVRVDTSNGRIGLRLPCTRSGRNHAT